MKKYVANLTQETTNAPHEVAFDNSIGTMTFARVAAGTYTMTCGDSFPEGRVHILHSSGSDDYSEGLVTIGRNSDSELVIYTRAYDFPNYPVLQDGCMGVLSIQITVFD